MLCIKFIVRPEADPPVCKIIDYDAMMKDKNKKEKEEKIKAKAKEMREIHLGVRLYLRSFTLT